MRLSAVLILGLRCSAGALFGSAGLRGAPRVTILAPRGSAGVNGAPRGSAGLRIQSRYTRRFQLDLTKFQKLPSSTRILMKFSGKVSFTNTMNLSKFQVQCTTLADFRIFLNIEKISDLAEK